MSRKYFGTDGIRGTANSDPMTAEIALKVGMAAGAQFITGDHRYRVVIGKDTRLSGYMLEPALTSGFVLAIMMANAGGAWDNAKKFIEGGAHGGKGSAPHKAAVVGDTVGDPFKDTSGPSINILLKLMSMVSIVFVTTVIALNDIFIRLFS